MMVMNQIIKDLERLGMSPAGIQNFSYLIQKYHSGPAKISDWKSVQSPSTDSLLQYDSLDAPDESNLQNQLSRLVVCKLNGGLGTSMGCKGPKSAIPVCGDKSFLDLIVDQIAHFNHQYNTQVPLLLMNSFYTHDDTLKMVRRYGKRLAVQSFCQNQFPRLNAKTGHPIGEKFGREAWYPPGHGDFYSCIQEQGILDQFLQQGRDILFVSNADNLGAEIDRKILNLMASRPIPFLMEMTPKTSADVKGGTLYQQGEKLKLLEIARVPDEHLNEFCGQEKFKVFNTNNIWINLAQLKAKLEEGPMDLGVIVNKKSVGDLPVVQLETAIGSALDSFASAVGLTVSRDRFRPVKTTSDLFLIQSDLFVREKGVLRINPERQTKNLPLIQFGETLKHLEDYNSRIPEVPSLHKLKSLEIRGDVRFSGRATLEGDIRLIANDKPLVIEEGSFLHNTVIEQ